MTDIDLKNALLAGDPNSGEETEEIKTHAGVVVVRALSRAEVMRLQAQRDREDWTYVEFEQHMVAVGLVEPKMTPGEVEKWQAVDRAKGALEDVTEAISRLSGLFEGADKSGVPAVRGKPRRRV